MIGFETIGNATAICIDDRPVLVTDPWIAGDAYFGSWGLSHEIPREQRDHARMCAYVWLSHGHPDHTSAESLDLLRDKTILLPDHQGGRMRRDLTAIGFRVEVLPDRTWRQLSPHIRVLCIADYNQDAILLIDVGGKLLVDLNDAVDRGWGRFVAGVVSAYETSFLLKLFGYGDADMINVYREGDPERLLPPPPTSGPEARAAWDALLAEKIRFWTGRFGTPFMVPFSCFHAYRRTDSAWAQEYATPLSALTSVQVPGCEILPAFIRYDCERNLLEQLDPPATTSRLMTPEALGDDPGAELDADDVRRVVQYFTGIEHLRTRVDFVVLRVGGREHSIDLSEGRRVGRGMTFEVPRGSLMTAVEHEIFDDLLIGNFMKTTLHGDWGTAQAPNVLYRHFTPFVTRYADNAQVKTDAALAGYLASYRKRAPFDYLMHRFEQGGVDRLRSAIPQDSGLFRVATRAYAFLKGQGSGRDRPQRDPAAVVE